MSRIRIEKDLEKSLEPGSLITTNNSNDPYYLSPQANGDVLSFLNGQVIWSSGNENLAIPLAFNNETDFQLGHSSIVVNNKMYIGTRINGGTGNKSKLVCYPDCNDLSTFTFVEGPASTFGIENSFEAMCYDPITDKIIIPLSNTANLFVVDPNNLASNSVVPISLSGEVFGTSSPIMSNNVGSIYCFTNGATSSKVIEINTTTFNVLATTAIPGGIPPHSGQINLVDNQLYFAPLGPPFSKMDLSTNAITQIVIPNAAYTDDMCFIPADPFWVNGNMVLMVAEYRLEGSYNKGGVLIDVDNMTYLEIDLLPGFGLWYDPNTYYVLNASHQGFIEAIYIETLMQLQANTIDSLISSTDVYTFRGITPNELLLTSCGYFATTWGPNQGTEPGHLVKFELKKVANPVITKTEFRFRK